VLADKTEKVQQHSIALLVWT